MNAKKFYLIYKITNNLNLKFYIGKHETNNLDDDYFGSGKHLINALNKYGLENFTKTILFYCYNQEEMNLLEHYVVTSEFCLREDVYNIMEGGDGGWDYVNLSSDFAIGSEKRKILFHSSGGKACLNKYRDEYGSFTLYVLLNMEVNKREELRLLYSLQYKKNCSWHGKKHKLETKDKISDSLKGIKCKHFGKKAVYDLNTGKRVYVDSLENLPSNLVLKLDFNKAKGILSKKEKRKLLKLKKKEAYIKETLEMADYFTKYGYEETCKKFPNAKGIISCESMLMRFIRARKKYGIKFESIKNGRKRKFLLIQ